jgi:16S rRNA processing protein RimM
MTAAWDDMVVVGTVARPHGLRGGVIVQPQTDFPEDRFQPGRTVYLGGRDADSPRSLVVREARPHLRRWLVSFEGVDRVEDAEPLAGAELRVPADELRPLPAGHFYHHDLIGCDVITVGGTRVGRVSAVDDAGGTRLVVLGPQGEALVPLAEEICVEIDVAGRRIVVAPPEGLLDVNR